MIKKNKLYIFIFFILILFSVLIYFKVPCLFKLLFKIPCPGCGMTRAFFEIFKFNFSKAFYYNILSIPLFIFIIYCIILIIYDILYNKNIFFLKLDKLFSKYYLLIIFLLIISEVINIYHTI